MFALFVVLNKKQRNLSIWYAEWRPTKSAFHSCPQLSQAKTRLTFLRLAVWPLSSMAQTAFAAMMVLALLVAGAAGFICFKKVSLTNNEISFTLKLREK